MVVVPRNSVRLLSSTSQTQGSPLTLVFSLQQQGAPSFLPPKQPAMPPSNLPPPPPPPPAADISALVAAKRAEVQAKLAAMRSKMNGGGAPSPPPPAGRSTLPPVPGLPKPNLDPDLARKVADAKKLVESFQARSRAAAMPANPYLVRWRASPLWTKAN